MTVLAFSSTVLTSNTMRNSMFLKESTEVAVFTAPVRLNMNDFVVKKALNMCLKLKKYSEHIRFTLKQIKPGETTVSINETDIVIMTTD
jgi:hypothetical protein